MARESIGIRPVLVWARGEAVIGGDEIVLDGRATEEYAAFGPEHSTELLFDLADLQNVTDFGTFPNLSVTDPQRARRFASRHGLLWHGAEHLGNGECRESLRAWISYGYTLGVCLSLYMTIQESFEEGSAEPVRGYLRMLRDAERWHRLPLPNDDVELVEYASIQLAELVTRGMADCTPTFIAACSLVDDGTKLGNAGDFRFANDPGSLVGAAYYALARFISRKERFGNCEGCGRVFQVRHASQRFCEKKCATRKRQRELRQKNRLAN
jgi:hypothetical protein